MKLSTIAAIFVAAAAASAKEHDPKEISSVLGKLNSGEILEGNKRKLRGYPKDSLASLLDSTLALEVEEDLTYLEESEGMDYDDDLDLFEDALYANELDPYSIDDGRKLPSVSIGGGEPIGSGEEPSSPTPGGATEQIEVCKTDQETGLEECTSYNAQVVYDSAGQKHYFFGPTPDGFYLVARALEGDMIAVFGPTGIAVIESGQYTTQSDSDGNIFVYDQSGAIVAMLTPTYLERDFQGRLPSINSTGTKGVLPSGTTPATSPPSTGTATVTYNGVQYQGTVLTDKNGNKYVIFGPTRDKNLILLADEDGNVIAYFHPGAMDIIEKGEDYFTMEMAPDGSGNVIVREKATGKEIAVLTPAFFEIEWQ